MNPPLFRIVVLAVLAILSGCAATPPAVESAAARVAAKPVDPALAAKILALDPKRVSDSDVREVLARGPTPRIVLIHGGVYGVELLMESFGRFLVGMGYPESQIRDPRDGSWSWSPYADGALQAGAIAWYYQQDGGTRPMIIGHSQGGIQAVKILHQFAGTWTPTLRPFDPITNTMPAQPTVVDPLTGEPQPVVGFTVAYASVVGTGGWALALPGHWNVSTVIRQIPNTVDEFVGFRIGVDFFAWDLPGLEGLKTFSPTGKAVVRNVTLPAEYSHVFVPDSSDLAQDPAARAWISEYVPPPGDDAGPDPKEFAGRNIVWASYVWYDIKKHWTLEAQRAIRAQQQRGAAATTATGTPTGAPK
jgi:hypothetical protein